MKRWLMLLIILSSQVNAQGPAALVESVSEVQSEVNAFDFLYEGDQVDLGPVGQITLGYLANCVRESIVGGQITIGSMESETKGSVSITKSVESCNSEQLVLASNEIVQSGATAYRALGSSEPELVLEFVQPIILTSRARQIVLKRLDEKESRVKLKLDASTVSQATDLVQEGFSLTPGGTYMLTASGRSLVFKVSNDASTDTSKFMSRLLVPR